LVVPPPVVVLPLLVELEALVGVSPLQAAVHAAPAAPSRLRARRRETVAAGEVARLDHAAFFVESDISRLLVSQAGCGLQQG
jgi:hypothetical protein